MRLDNSIPGGGLRRFIGGCVLPAGACAVLALAPAQRADAQGAAESARVSGVVYDSIAGAPLESVTVHFVAADGDAAGRTYSALTDRAGRYRIDALPAGSYVAGFFHASLDTLGLETGPRLLTVRSGAQTIPFATPSPRTLRERLCPPTPGSEGTGLLLGHVRAAANETAIDGAAIIVEWTEIVIDEGGIRSRTARVQGASTGPGWFAICHLPTDAVLQTRAAFGADSSGWIAVDLPPDGMRHVTYFISPLARSGDDAVADEQQWLRGTARLTGTVRDANGQPMADAHVVVWETGQEAVTGPSGAFVLDSLPSGSHMIEARTLGYVPVHQVVHLAERRPATADLVFRDRAVVLPTVTTRASLVYSRHLSGFERRRRTGFGEFLTPAQIEAKPEMRLGRLLQEMQGLELETRAGQTLARMRASRGAGSRYCTPSLYVDGLLDRSGDLDLIYSSRVAAVEVYNREFSRPAEFADRNQCGAIVVWMRPITQAKKTSK